MCTAIEKHLKLLLTLTERIDLARGACTAARYFHIGLTTIMTVRVTRNGLLSAGGF